MSTIYRILVALVGALVAVGHVAGAPASEPTPLGAEDAAALLSCRVSLATARDQLTTRGYAVDGAGTTAFSTQYKMSERDSSRRLLGGLAVERARRYQVSAVGSDALRFVPRYRETVFATGVLGNRNDTVREYDVPLTTAMVETLKDMRREVCDPIGQQPSAGDSLLKLDVQQYLQDRCKEADARACRLLQVR